MKGFQLSLQFLLFSVFLLTGPARAQNPEADNLRSDLLTQQGDDALKEKKNQEALAFYTQATELNTKNGKAWTRLGRLTYAMGDVEKAKSFLKEGWACGDVGGLRTLGALALLEGNYAAFEEIRPDLMKEKNDIEIRAMLILYLDKIGKMTTENLDPVMEGMDLNHLTKVSKANLDRLAQAYEALGKDQEAAVIAAELKRRNASTTAPSP